MSNLQSYFGRRTKEVLCDAGDVVVFRAWGVGEDGSVIVKTMGQDSGLFPKHDRLLNEYRLLQTIDSRHVIRPLGFERRGGAPAIFMEDIEGTPLNRMLADGPLDWLDAVRVAERIADALQDVHAAGVVHRDIKPSNIVWNVATDELRLIDFSLAIHQDPGASDYATPELLEGSIPYVSPEQTGRIGVPLDYRSDFYALGATLFELLTGRPPFVSDDTMAVVHAHIARTPDAVSAINPQVPQAVSAIVAKLLEKSPSDRYQSAFGLKVDLRRVLEAASTGDRLAGFLPGAGDVSSRFALSGKLYGRGEDLDQLRATLRRVRRGAFEIAIIAGPPGAGKTRLVEELAAPARAVGDRFASGKFDPAMGGSPYSGIGQALNALVAGVIGDGDAAVQVLAQRLGASLGADAALAVQIVPELRHVLGALAPAGELPPLEAQARITLALRQVIRAFAADGHAVILFLDDLQWADAASVQFLATMAGDTGMGHVLLLGAYRDTEVDADHLLASVIDDVEKTQTPLTRLTIGSLAKQDTVQLIADSLFLEDWQVMDLADACVEKTLGNPFFLGQFLQALYRQDYIAFDARKGRWHWQADRIAGADLAENVVDLMVDRIQDLPAEMQDILRYAALLGGTIDAATLSAVAERPQDDMARVLRRATSAGLIAPTSFEAAGAASAADKADHTYRFAHDRVQEAAALLSGPEDAPKIHLRIARILSTGWADRPIDDGIFQIAWHFDRAGDLLTDPEERLSVAAANLAASRRARVSGGFRSGLRYAEVGLDLLPDDAWSQHYDLTLGLHDQAITCAHVTQQRDRIEGRIANVLAKARTTLDTTRVVEIQILMASRDGRLGDAVTVGLQFLARLGVTFPKAPTDADERERLSDVQALLAGRDAASLGALPAMTDPTALAVMRTFNALASPTYNHSPPLFLCMVFTQLEWLVDYGNGADAAVLYSTYAIALCVVAEDYAQGDAFAALALTLADRWRVEHLRARINLNVFLFVHHWRHHLDETLGPLAAAGRAARDHGDPLFAAIIAHVICHHRLFTSTNLHDVDAAMGEQLRIISDQSQRHIHRWTEIFAQTTKNLMGEAEVPTALIGEVFDETKFDLDTEGASDQTIRFLYHFNKLILAVTFGDVAMAARHLEPAEDHLPSVMGIVHVPVCRQYGFLGRLMLLEDPGRVVDPDHRAALLDTLREHRDQMEVWAASAPMNYGHKHALMAAELCRLDGDTDQAATLFETAIGQAAAHGYEWDRALCQERTGLFYRAKGLRRIAKLYLSDALHSYRQWGAEAKAENLLQLHPDLIDQPTAAASSRTRSSDTGGVSQDNLDLDLVLKGSQAIAAEIVLDRLLDRMMGTVLETAGADRGVLVRVDPAGQLHVWVESRVGGDTKIVSDASAYDPGEVLPVSGVNYVAATGQNVILGRFGGGDWFATDPYYAANTPKSAMCLPVRSRNRLIGVFYLENTVTADAFVDRHLEVLGMLAGQIATSLENARLYEDLEHRVAERTEALQDKMAELSQAYNAMREGQTRLENQASALRQAKEVAEEANRSKSAFLASVSHELRTPLNAIMGFSELLKDNTFGPVAAATMHDYAGNIYESGKHLLELIDDLLDLAKIEAGRIELEPESLDLRFEVRACIRLVANRAANHQLDLSHSVPADMPPLVADRRALRQMLFNLLSNAIKFTPQGGAVTVAAQVDAAGAIRIAVADTGIGIAPDDHAAVFVPFRRTKEAERGGIQGTGLGLPIVKSLIEAHGGSVTLASTQGAGTEITLTFPTSATGARAGQDA